MRPILIPDYFNDFSCIGNACEDALCTGWNVTVDKETYQTYYKFYHPGMAEKLQKYMDVGNVY